MLRAAAREVSPEDPDRVVAEWGSMYPVGRVGLPGEIADAILYLVSPLASFVTGSRPASRRRVARWRGAGCARGDERRNLVPTRAEPSPPWPTPSH